uniref:tRNA-binding domain-containing protein n=1 Tax=Macrostomum lignano TaxID=282301 RepID=A0A1I8FLF2_9PLAT
MLQSAAAKSTGDAASQQRQQLRDQLIAENAELRARSRPSARRNDPDCRCAKRRRPGAAASCRAAVVCVGLSDAVAAPTPSAAAEKPKADSKAGSAATAATAAASNKKPGKPRIPASQPSRRKTAGKEPRCRRRRSRRDQAGPSSWPHCVRREAPGTLDALYVETVDVGEERPRTIVSGLAAHVPLPELQGRLAVFLLNLKPAKMRGISSEGMIMCASASGKVETLSPPPGVSPGDRVSVAGCPSPAEAAPDAQLNPKKKIWKH